MDIEFAECGEHQSGQRFLDSSVPRLTRHATSCETAGVGVTHLPAGKDQKLSQELEDGVLIGREAPVPSLLDFITNNRHKVPKYYVRPVGRGKYCGRYSTCGRDPKTGSAITRRVNCGSWTCSYCGPKKARLAKYRIRVVAEEMGLCYFWTLTMRERKFANPKERVLYVRKVFNKLREYLRREYGTPPNYVCVLEFTKKGAPHLHVLFDRRIEHAWMSATWDRLGAGYVVWVKRVKVNKVARYLSKYLTKELLLSAPKGARRITTSRSIKLFPKFKSEIVWEFLRESIWSLLATHRAANFNRQADLFHYTLLHSDEDGILKAFEVVTDE